MSITDSDVGTNELEKIYAEASLVGEDKGKELKFVWESDTRAFFEEQERNATGKRGNRWSLITIRLGINEESILDSSKRYEEHIVERVKNGHLPPLKQGILIWDETKVQSKIIWNSSNSSITGYAMSSSDMASLHDVYEGLDEEEESKKTEYVLQFLWRDISSEFDVIGPYFTISGTIEAQHLHTLVMKTLLVFNQFEFRVRCLLCDGASGNLALLKELCAHKKGKDISANFVSPFDGNKIHLVICPSHQVSIDFLTYYMFPLFLLKNMIAALYSSRDNGGTKSFVNEDSVHFGWETIEDVYKVDMKRAKNGQTRRVLKLKYSHIIRDSWTRLNVLPAKIMQQPYMLDAIQALADARPDEMKEHLATLEYLKACNKLFEDGILSHQKVDQLSSKVLKNIDEGYAFFKKWKDSFSNDANLREPTQKCFLAWQTWDLLELMYHGFKGFCHDFLTEHPHYYIIPVRISGSAIESVFSCLKFISGSNLSSVNYSSSITALATQREKTSNTNAENNYRNIPLSLK
uniref:Transposable element P transposase-like RNase H domain-containing protein n=1 Tax=Amphimedon queenslandica TaxID=400682 RepID=A0A1X7V628_AMPQE